VKSAATTASSLSVRSSRVEAITQLSRAGYSTEEIAAVVEEPDADSDEET
jgi:hypothetical protein